MKLETKIKLYYLFKLLQNVHFFGAVLVPFYTIWAGMTEQTVLLIQSWFMLCVTILELPTGLVADYFGRKNSLVLGGLAATVGFILYGLYANIYLFLFSEFVLALAMSFISGADEAWLIDTLNQHNSQERKTEIVGKGQSFLFMGMIIGSVIGSLIASYVSLNATMYLSAIPAVLLFVICLKLPEPKIHQTTDETFKWQQGILSLRQIFANQSLRFLSVNLILVSVAAYFVLWLYQPFLQRIGIPLAWYGLIHALFLGFEIIISNRFSWIEKKLGLVGYLKWSAILTSVGFFLLLSHRSLATILIFVLTAGSIGLTRRYFAVGYFHDFVNSTYRASISSSFSLLLRLATAIANVIVGWLFVRTENVTLFVLGLLPLIAILFFPVDKVFSKKDPIDLILEE